MLKKLHKRYHYSPKALRELREIADALDEKIIKPTRLQGTRWIPHMNKATKTLARIFPVLVAHFEHVGEAGPGQATAEVRGRGRFLTTKLRDFRVLRFMFFFRDVLDILSRFSLRLQQKSVSCVDFLDSLETANLEVGTLRLQPGECLQQFYDALQVNDGNCTYKDVALTHYDPNRDHANFRGVIDSITEKVNRRLENP